MEQSLLEIDLDGNSTETRGLKPGDKLIHCVFGGMSWQVGEDLIGCLLWLDTSNRSSITQKGIDVQRMHQLLCVY